jgi:hypothetical protein
MSLAAEPLAPVAEPRHCPQLGTIMRRVGLSLMIACVVPGALFYVCFHVAGVWTAIRAAVGGS